MAGGAIKLRTSSIYDKQEISGRYGDGWKRTAAWVTNPAFFDQEARLLVVGDLMLDGYARGDVERISPEAPVPVLKHLTHHEVPGGAANVAMNIAALGGRPTLVGLVGSDDEGRRLAAMLTAAGVVQRLIIADDRPTTFKLRMMAGNHQMLRIDKETVAFPAAIAELQLIEAVLAELPGKRAVILSDYCKGCLSDRLLAEVITRARDLAIPVIVDPKRADFAAYAGASFLTPNRGELSNATGIACDDDDQCRLAAQKAITRTGAAVVLTRSEHGMSFYSFAGEEIMLPTAAVEVFDVSGAGDSVVAAFGYAVASGVTVPQALRLANCLAGLVVAKVGTATASKAEVIAALEHADPTAQPISGAATWREAIALRQKWAEGRLRVGFANGCFDLLHPGHVALLREAAQQCDRLIVALNSDVSVRRLKGPSRPVQDEQARAEVLGAIRHVDCVVLFGEDTPQKLIEALKPDLLIKGSDYQEHEIAGAAFVRGLGGCVLRVDLRDGHSTTNIIARSHG